MAVDGTYSITMQTMMGPQSSKVTLKTDGNKLSGTDQTSFGTANISGTVNGNELTSGKLGDTLRPSARGILHLFSPNPSELSANTSFVEDLKAKSVNLVQIIAILEDAYDVPINSWSSGGKTLGEAAEFVAQLCRG
jgi:acyl carrier protein